MPNLTKPKKNSKNTIETVVFCGAMIVIFLLDVTTLVRLALAFGVFAVYLFYKRGFLIFAKAVKLMQKEDPRCWDMFKKAVKAGLATDRKNMVATAFIQRADDFSYGIELLEDIIRNDKGKDLVENAMVTVSMGYWRQGRMDEAIEILWGLYEDGMKDNNLAVNLGAYLLETGDLERATQVSVNAKADGSEPSGLVDNRLWRAMLEGRWEDARDLADELVNDRVAKFPEAYVHAAQVHVHDGDIPAALDCLNWSLSKTFTKTCVIKKDYVEKLILGLDNPATREAFAKAMDENVSDVAISHPFEGFETACEFEGPKHQTKSQEEVNAASLNQKSIASDAEQTSDLSIEDDDDRMPNTDLDESDFADEDTNEQEDDKD